MKFIKHFFAAAIVLIPVMTVSAEQIARSGPAQVALIEAYTSEGCSSCVPAWAWLTRLKDHPGLWKDFVPVSFHVDYWDYLGWKDPLAQNAFSRRQREYAAFWGNGRVYTPGFVLNGQEWRLWYRPGALKNLSGAQAGELAVDRERMNSLEISYRPGQEEKSGKYTAHIAVLGFGFVSRISAGENRGRKEEHHFAVLDYKKKEMDPAGPEGWTARDEIGFLDDSKFTRYGIAVWVTSADSPRPIQAAGGFL